MEEGIACGIGLISMGVAIYILEWFQMYGLLIEIVGLLKEHTLFRKWIYY
jgi:hypothetical protein